MNNTVPEEPETVGLYLTQDGSIVSNDKYGYWRLRTHELAWNDPVADLDEQHYDTGVWEDFFRGALTLPGAPTRVYYTGNARQRLPTSSAQQARRTHGRVHQPAVQQCAHIPAAH